MVDTKKWFLLAASVLLYCAALLWSAWLWWAVFIFLVPLYYVASTRTLSFKEGFFYGLLLWSLHVSGVYYSIIEIAQGPMIIRFLPVFVIIIYQAFFVGVWFWITQKIIKIFSMNAVSGKLAIWVATTALYFYWAVSWSLFPFNALEGYFFMHPLLPLAEHPILLSLMPYIGSKWLMVLLLATNAFITLPFLGYTLWLAVAASVPWVLSIGMGSVPTRVPAPHWSQQIAYIPKIFLNGYDLTDFAEDIQKKIKDLMARYPETKIIIFPESSFDRINLSSAGEIAELWGSRYISQPVNLIIGAVNWEKNKYRNAAYWVYDGKVKAVFNKRHAMLLTEGISPWYDWPFFRSLYHQLLPPIIPSTNPRLAFPLLNGMNFTPYICSELFFNDQPDDASPQSVIISLCNDNWSSVGYVRRMMYLGARFKAIEWQRYIVYASYHHSGIIDKQGEVTPLHE